MSKLPKWVEDRYPQPAVAPLVAALKAAWEALEYYAPLDNYHGYDDGLIAREAFDKIEKLGKEKK